MSKAIIVISMMVFAFAILLLFQSGSLISEKPLPSEEGISALIHIPPNQEKIGKLDILFIGNSYTFMHSMPLMVANIAKSDTKNAIELNIQSVAFSAARLKDHWADERAKQILQQKPWDFVILQDQSDWATHEDGIIDNHAYITRFKQIAKQTNEKALVAVFKTWPKQKDSAWYTNPDTRKTLRNYEYMRLAIDQNTRKNANKANLDIVPAGDYWLYILDNNIPISLYSADGSHPSVAGSYLNALVFYRYFTMSDLNNVTYIPVGLTQQHALKLHKIAKFGDIK